MTQRLQFNIHVSHSEILKYYQGHAKNLIVTLNSGQRVQLPVQNFRPFVNDLGLHGEFEVEFSDQFKLISLNKLSD